MTPVPPEIRLRGEGTVEVTAFGLADAEHLVEKELGRLWPDARATVLEARRADPAAARLVEHFRVAYRIDAKLPAATPRAAFRAARERLAGSRYAGTQWERQRAEETGDGKQ